LECNSKPNINGKIAETAIVQLVDARLSSPRDLNFHVPGTKLRRAGGGRLGPPVTGVNFFLVLALALKILKFIGIIRMFDGIVPHSYQFLSWLPSLRTHVCIF
jgi:hypothetical protein